MGVAISAVVCAAIGIGLVCGMVFVRIRDRYIVPPDDQDGIYLSSDWAPGMKGLWNGKDSPRFFSREPTY